MTQRIILALSAMLLMLPALVAAQSKPVNVALVNPIQIFPEDNAIEGIRLNVIYGKNISMTGLDIGLVNAVGTGEFQGVQYGLVNLDDGKVTGIQWGGVNIPNGDFTGFQVGWLNLANKNVTGLQYGLFNKGGYVNGLQLGFVNYAESMKGLQIGLVNIIKTGGQFPVFPIVNWSF